MQMQKPPPGIPVDGGFNFSNCFALDAVWIRMGACIKLTNQLYRLGETSSVSKPTNVGEILIMKFKSLLVASFSLAAIGLSFPAHAIDGRTAVGMCIDSTATGARCGWSVSQDGSIDICNKNGCVTCPSATGECTVAREAPVQPLPTQPLPTQPLRGQSVYSR